MIALDTLVNDHAQVTKPSNGKNQQEPERQQDSYSYPTRGRGNRGGYQTKKSFKEARP